tara:strand:+ start:198 stop:866 length:669 start_codon:yes stop_codon:yes gene_type:complete
MDENKLSFTEILQQNSINLASASNITAIEILSALFFSLLCSVIIAWTYKSTFQGVLYQHSYLVSLVLASVITSSVIMVISGNLILSLGMVGALSIVRFRSAIKDPLDIVFMFWAITVGIANGIGMIKLSIIATLLISLVCFILYKIPKTLEPHVLILKYDKADMDNILQIIRKNSLSNKLISQTANLGQGEVVYKIRPKDNDNLLKEIRALKGINEASLLLY